MLFHFKTFDAPLAAHLEMSSKEAPFKIPENFCFLFSFVSFVCSTSLTLCTGLLCLWPLDAVKCCMPLSTFGGAQTDHNDLAGGQDTTTHKETRLCY